MFSVVRKPAQPSLTHPALFLTKWDPFQLMESLFVDTQPGQAVSSRHTEAYTPRFDVKDTKDGFLFKADLPGVREEDVEISLTANRLTISGKRQAEERQEGEKYHLYERTYGTFSRTFTLPESADTDKITASLKDGVLTLSLPKRSEAQPRKVALGKA